MGRNYWEMLHLAHTAEAGGGGGRGGLDPGPWMQIRNEKKWCISIRIRIKSMRIRHTVIIETGIQCCGSGSGIRCLFDPCIRDPE